MQLQNVRKFLLDQSPRQVWRFLTKKFLFRRPLNTFDDDHPCVFVLSTGRTGTETLAALFTLATNVISLHEPMPKLYELAKLAYEFSHDPLAHRIITASFLSHRIELLKTSLAYGLGYVESSPQVTFLAPAIGEAYPMAKFIHLVRDPRQVVRSGMRRGWYEGHPNDATRIVPKHASQDERKWSEYNSFQKNLWLWAETNRWILEYTSHLPSERVLCVHSEEVFSGDERALQWLYQFINADMPRSRKIKQQLNKKLNAQASGDFPPSALWSAEQKDNLFTIAGNTAEKLGYDLLRNDG